MDKEFLFYIEANGKSNVIRGVQTGDDFLESRFDFWLLTEDKEIKLKTNADNELVGDLCAIMGIDPVKELENLMREEIKKELELNDAN